MKVAEAPARSRVIHFDLEDIKEEGAPSRPPDG